MRFALFFLAGLAGCAGALRAAPFVSDATPPAGHPLIGKKILQTVDEPLLVKGVVLEDRGTRWVLAAVDWCTMGPGVFAAMRRSLAEAAHTSVSRVRIHSTHTHSAPFQNDYDPSFVKEASARAAAAVGDALGRLRRITHIGTGQFEVREFASNRRVPGPDGKIRVRYSSTKDAALRAEPEGLVDPKLRALSLFDGEAAVARLHFYASHPQSFYGDGHAHPDTAGWARKRLEGEDDAAEIYFTGCAGNVTAGKYNDGSAEARARLIQRLYEGMKGAISATRRHEIDRIDWKTAEVRLPPRGPAEPLPAIEVARLRIGPADVVFLPGEPFVEFQLYAQSLRPERFVCAAGYGDGAPGYICTDDAQGGYEPTASFVGPPSEKILKVAIEDLLR